MKTWIYSDSQGRIMATNANDMTGNTGWSETEQDVPDPIMDSRGIALYKLVDVQIVARSQQEIDADVPEEPEPKPSDSQRIDALEQELAEMEASYTKGVNEA